MEGELRIGKLLIATTALSAAMMCGAAHAAGYQVTATSNAYAGNIYSGGRGHCTYGLTVSGGECTQGTATYGGASSAGITPLGGAGNARSVTAMTMGSGAGASATSRTNADLATASLHLYGADSGQTYNISSQSTPFGGTLEAGTLRDTLHFTVLGASPTTVTRITAIFTLDGRMYPVGGNVDMPNSASGEIYGDLHFGTLPSRFDLKNNLSTGFVTTVGYLDNYPSGHANTWTTNTDHTINTSTFTYDLVGAASDIAFDLNAICNAAAGSSAITTTRRNLACCCRPTSASRRTPACSSPELQGAFPSRQAGPS